MSRYVVSTWGADTVRETFEDALQTYRKWVSAPAGRRPVFIHNLDRCDYATDTGWDPGLTDEEKERLEEVEHA